MRIALAFILSFMLIGTVVARSAHHHRGHFICGTTQMAYFGIHDPAFALSTNWLRFPRTTPHPGAVVFNWRKGRNSAGGPGGHVARIVQVLDQCRSMVADEKGTYVRNICGSVVVQPS